MEPKQKKSASPNKLTPRYLLYVIDEQKREAVKYSQVKQSFKKLFSCHKYSDKIEEVQTEMWIDGNKVIHSKAPYDDDKVYHQAKNIFEANVMFKKFLEHKSKIENEKEKNQTATPKLPQ